MHLNMLAFRRFDETFDCGLRCFVTGKSCHGTDQIVDSDGLCQVDLIAGIESSYAILVARKGSHRGSRYTADVRLRHGAETLDQPKTIVLGHTDVTEQDVETFVRQEVEGVNGCGGRTRPPNGWRSSPRPASSAARRR